MTAKIRYRSDIILMNDGQFVILNTKNKTFKDNIIVSVEKDYLRDFINGKTTKLILDTESITDSVFKGSSKLTEVELYNTLNIGGQAFANCINLTSIFFNSVVEGIEADAFANCPNLTTIDVPWLEGEVANAPWGATNATINYNR